MADHRSQIAGSARAAPHGRLVGDAPQDEVAQVSIYLKPTTSPAEQADTAARTRRFRTRDELHSERVASLASQIAEVSAFAEREGLKVVETHPGRRLVKVEGTIKALQSAFGTQLQTFEQAGTTFRARSGALSVPSAVSDVMEAVLGLDQRPVATPKSVRLSHAAAAQGFAPNHVVKLYGFPEPAGSSQGGGGGECIAIIELGGGFTASDTKAAFKAMKLKPPTVEAVAVSGGANAPGKDADADGEVALDIQVAGAGAPGSTLAVYFAPNTDQGFVDAISQAAHDTANKPSVMSISWGSAESGWTQQAIAAMTSTFQDAATLGLTVLAVWNSDGGGTGGGISDLFAVPAYQANADIPVSVNGARRGRGVPDVAGDADPNTGYRVVVDGQHQVIGGTSAVAPLWAGLFAVINAAAGKPSGQPHAILYANAGAFRDTTVGDNKSGAVGYVAAAGWDACTGVGSPQGAAIAA